jgi:crotonobetainyl-CoA:carnitine CoA-transferase CaiB-like acyl-CoA transferase
VPGPPAGPLAGVRVVDITHVLAGSYCSMLLADMGADVVKVERRGGDDGRGRGAADGFGPANRNKRSLVVDLATADGRAVVRRLAAQADVLVENYRPGALDARGLGYDDLVVLNPALVYCSISGFGGTGPERDRRGFDLVAQAMSGLMSVTGHAGAEPVKVGVPLADLNAGAFGALGVLSAYVERLRTGRGQRVDTSLLEGALAYTVWESAEYFATGEAPGPTGSAHRLTAPYQAFPTADGWVAVGAANQATWERLAALLGVEHLVEDERFRSPWSRVRRRAELADLLAPAFAADTTAGWCARLEQAGVPAGPINDLAGTWAEPQVLARGMLVEAPDGHGGTGRFIGPPAKLSATPWAVRRGVPAAGADTRAVLADAGYDGAEIDRLVAAGVVEAADEPVPAPE